MNHETTPPYLRDQFTTCNHICLQSLITCAIVSLHDPLRMLKSTMQWSFTVACRLDFFTYRNLFRNEISHAFSSKSLINLVIHSNAHIYFYQSLENWMNFGARNRVPVVFRLNFTEITWDHNLWPVFYQIYFKLIYTFRHYFDSLFPRNITF